MKLLPSISAAILMASIAVHAEAQQKPRPAPAPEPAPEARAQPPLPPAPQLPQASPQPPAPPRTPPPGQLVNIRVDVTVAEEGGGEAPSRKTVSLTLADRQSGSVRSIETVEKGRANLNVDVFPMMQRDGRVLTQITIDYSTPAGSKISSIRVEPLLTSERALTVSQAVSPTSDRRVTVDVIATVIK